MKLRIFGCKRFWSLKFLMCWSSNFDSSLQLHWLIVVDDSLNRLWWDLDDFDTEINDENPFVVVISETWMFHCCFLDDSLMTLWGDIFETLKISMEAFLIFIVIAVLFCVSLMYHYCFLDESLMMLWRDIVEALIISKETFLIFIVFVVLTSEWLIFHCWFFENSLMILWRNIDDTAKLSFKH